MTDERLRELERRWNQTGATNTLEALMSERERRGDCLGAAQDARRLLEENSEHVTARNTVAKYAPLLWTGYVWQYQPKDNHLYFSETSTGKRKIVAIRPLLSQYLDIWDDSRIMNFFVTPQGLHVTILERNNDQRRGTLLTLGTEEPHITNLPHQRAFPDFDSNSVLTTRPDDSYTIGTIMTSSDKPYTEHPLYISAHPIRVTQKTLLAHSGNRYAYFDLQNGQADWEPRNATALFIEDNQVTPIDANIHDDANFALDSPYLPKTSRIKRQENRAQMFSDLASLCKIASGCTITHFHEIPITVLDTLHAISESQKGAP